MVKQSVDLVANELRLSQVECELDLDPDLPTVRCDRRQVQQVLVNLLQNGIEAIGNHGKVMVFSRRAEGRDGVVLGVSDDGRGIPADSLSRVFEPFYTTKAAGEGSGLGLAVAHGIVSEHHGAIEVVRSDASGTEFRLLFPSRG